MLDWLKWVLELWRSSNGLTKVLVIVGIVAFACVSAEGAQSGFLGDAGFRVAARILPWQPFFARQKSIAALYEIERQGKVEPARSSAVCPLGSKIHYTYERTGPGWVVALGHNDAEGIYPIGNQGLEPSEVEGGKRYAWSATVTSSAGAEMIFIVGSDKPFDVRSDFLPVFEEWLRDQNKGAKPDFDGLATDRFDVSNALLCSS